MTDLVSHRHRARPETNSAFEQVYRAHVAVISAHFERRCREPQEVADLTSETFEEAIRSMPGFDPRRGTIRAWLFGIARHRYARHCERAAQGQALAQRVLIASPGSRGGITLVQGVTHGAAPACISHLSPTTSGGLQILIPGRPPVPAHGPARICLPASARPATSSAKTGTAPTTTPSTMPGAASSPVPTVPGTCVATGAPAGSSTTSGTATSG
jgi:hypothetical protein